MAGGGAGSGKHAMGVCDDGAEFPVRGDEGAGGAQALEGTFNAQEVENTLWAYATMGRVPWAGVMRDLDGRAEALAGTFDAQDVANTLCAACLFSILCAHQEGSRWVHTVAQRLMSLDVEAVNYDDPQRVHPASSLALFTWPPLGTSNMRT